MISLKMYFKVIYTLREFPPKPVHRFKPILSVISDLILLNFIQNSNGVDFCETYRNNSFVIDYSFGGNINPAFPPKGFLVIGQNYWKIDVNITSEDIHLISNESMVNTGFGEGYKTAFSYADELIGLIDVSIE